MLIPQDLDYPGIKLNVEREMASRLGLSSKETVDNVITALSSNEMIAPSYSVDPDNGNNYMLTVQYLESQVKSMLDLRNIPLRSKASEDSTDLDAVSDMKTISTPTEVDHYQLRRVFDVYVAPAGEDLGTLAKQVQHIIDGTTLPANVRVTTRGSVEGMRQSFKSFGIGLGLSVVLVYLILMAQFASVKDPFLILLAVPPGFTEVITLFTSYSHHRKCDVADGRHDDDRYRGVGFHINRGVEQRTSATGPIGDGSIEECLPCTPSSHPDDNLRDVARAHPARACA